MVSRPYLSFIFACRDDSYGGNLRQRVNTFLRYMSQYDKLYPGLFEFVVCDWNPPSNERTMAQNYNWDGLSDLKFVTVPPDLHNIYIGDRNSPFLDYIARNVAIRHATGEFVCILNQDIYLSQSLFDRLAQRDLDSSHYYRADRCDFFPDFERMANPTNVEAYAIQHSFAVHRRHSPDYDDDISPSFDTGLPVSVWPRSEAMTGDSLDNEKGVIVCSQSYSNKAKHWPQCIQLCRHTNASGDFLLASRKAFDDVHGFVETADFYVHTDSYAIFQLHAAGYKQTIFCGPNIIFHADHDRADRMSRTEKWDYQQHELIWNELVRGERAPQFNDSNWGLSHWELDVSVPDTTESCDAGESDVEIL